MYTSRYAISDVAPSTTDGNIVTAKDGVVLRVIGGFLVAAGTATTIVFNSKPTGSGTAITSTIFCGANGGLIFPSVNPSGDGEPPYGYFQTTKGQGLSATTGAGSTVGVSVVYIEI